jgi:signal recognition particle subunit SRP54
MNMLPEQLTGGIQINDEQSEQIEGQMKKTEAMIDSMTREERNSAKLINAGRKTRIANGSGTTIADVNALLKQYGQMRQMMTQMNKGGLLGKLGRGMMGGLGGLMGGGGMGGLGNGIPGGLLGGMGGGSDGGSDGPEDGTDSLSKRIKKKKRHKKR